MHTSAAASDARSRVSIALLLHSCFPCRTHLRLGPAAFHSTRSAAAWWSLATAHMCTKQAAIPLIIHLWPLHLAEAVARCLTGPNVILWPPSDQVLTQLNGQNGQPLASTLTPFRFGRLVQPVSLSTRPRASRPSFSLGDAEKGNNRPADEADQKNPFFCFSCCVSLVCPFIGYSADDRRHFGHRPPLDHQPSAGRTTTFSFHASAYPRNQTATLAR